MEFLESFGDKAEKNGVRRRHVEETIRKPDDVQHFLREEMQGTTFVPFSLYVKHHLNKVPHDFALLVETQRKDATLTVRP